MSLYPTLEDMTVDTHAKAQVAATHQVAQQHAAIEAGVAAPVAAGSLYSELGQALLEYGGLDVSEGALMQYMPPEVAMQVAHPPIASITPIGDAGMVRAHIKNGVRQVQLAKDGNGKLGFGVSAIDKGVFVAFVWQNSAAALGGVRFGDQILQIDGQSVAGWSEKDTLKVLKKADPTKVVMAIRDRPFERTLTVVKDHANQVGFVFKKGEITAIVKDSSAARNGLLIQHQLIEINGQNVCGLPDADIQQIIRQSDRSVTLTIMPTFVYNHLIKKIGFITKEKGKYISILGKQNKVVRNLGLLEKKKTNE
jgi:syntenin-1